MYPNFIAKFYKKIFSTAVCLGENNNTGNASSSSSPPIQQRYCKANSYRKNLIYIFIIRCKKNGKDVFITYILLLYNKISLCQRQNLSVALFTFFLSFALHRLPMLLLFLSEKREARQYFFPNDVPNWNKRHVMFKRT